MPEMPGPQGPEGGQGGGDAPGGGGIAETIVKLDQGVSQLVAAVQKAPVPDGVKQAGAAAQEAFRGFVQALMSAVKGGGQGPQAPATATPEQGGNPNAVPANPAGYGRG